MREVLSGQGKGVVKETLQVFVLELNESELPTRYRNLSRQYQKSGFPNLPGDKHRGNLGDIWPVLVLGIKAAGIT